MTTPICRCRVMYLGSAVPHVTKDGLQGIQEPLRDLYPENGAPDGNNFGIDSWVSVWSNGILIENVDDSGREVKRFFPIESLHYCAAVRYVIVPTTCETTDKNPSEKVSKFLPLDSPFIRSADTKHPPLFACILRRTAGIKVLECHAFICKREPAANALVRCCFHAYADSMYAKQIDENPYSQLNGRRSRSISALDTVDKPHAWNDSEKEGSQESSRLVNGHSSKTPSEAGAASTISQSHEEDNYKVWSGPPPGDRDGHPGMHITRTPRARQMIISNVATPPLPPPIPGIPMCKEKVKGFSHSLKKKKQSKKGQNGALMPIMYPPHIIANGYPVNFMSVPQLYPPGGHTHHPIYGPPSSMYSMKRKLKRGPPPMSIPQGGELPIVLGPAEEPLYIPPMRPLTPLSNYHPSQVDPHYVQFPPPNGTGTSFRKEKHRKEKSRKQDNSESESPFNTGIYRKKGHLNERAFSYSIRQEHRSRSNSLANIQFTNNDQEIKRSPQQGTPPQALQTPSSSSSAEHSSHKIKPVNGQANGHSKHNGHAGQNGHNGHYNGHTGHHNGHNGVPVNGTRVTHLTRDPRREKELSHSLASLHLNGTPSSSHLGERPMAKMVNGNSDHHPHYNNYYPQNGKMPKTASIKRGKQNGSTGKMTLVAPPVPVPPSLPRS